MKKLLFLIPILFAFQTIEAQTQYALNTTDLCWDSSGVKKSIVKLTYSTSSSNPERIIGYYNAQKGYPCTPNLNNTTVGFCADANADIEIFAVQMCNRFSIDFLRVFMKTNTGISVIGNFDYDGAIYSPSGWTNLRYTPCYQFAPDGGNGTAVISLKDTTLTKTPSIIPPKDTINVPTNCRDFVIYNMTESDIRVKADGLVGGENGKFTVAANSTYVYGSPKNSTVTLAAVAGTFEIQYLSVVGNSSPRVIIDFKSY